MTLLAGIRRILARNRIVKPIWNTEVNYGLVGGGAGARPISTERQVGNVMRTFVLNAENRVSRVYWYSWDLLGMSNTPDGPGRPDDPHPGRPGVRHHPPLAARHPPGRLHAGQDEHLDLHLHHGDPDPPGRVEPEPVGDVKAPLRTSSVTTWSSAARTARAGSRVRVGVVPVMISSRR